MMTDIVARIRGSPVVHADETGGREDDTTSTCGPSAPPASATSCAGAGAKPWWMRSWR